MQTFNDLAAVVNVVLPGWQCVEFYRQSDEKRIIIRAVQSGPSTENDRRWVFQITVMAGATDTAETVYAAANQLAMHFLSNYKSGGVLLIRVVRDVMGPFYDDNERPYYNFDIGVINTANS
jgi:hypothetical protein